MIKLPCMEYPLFLESDLLEQMFDYMSHHSENRPKPIKLPLKSTKIENLVDDEFDVTFLKQFKDVSQISNLVLVCHLSDHNILYYILYYTTLYSAIANAMLVIYNL